MEILIKTRYSLGDRVRTLIDTKVECEITCPFCEGEGKRATGIYKKALRMNGEGPVREEVLVCKNCDGTGTIRIYTDDIKRRTQKGIYEITGFRDINRVGECFYELTLVDNEGNKKASETIVEHDERLVPEREGFIARDINHDYTHGKPSLTDIVKQQIAEFLDK